MRDKEKVLILMGLAFLKLLTNHIIHGHQPWCSLKHCSTPACQYRDPDVTQSSTTQSWIFHQIWLSFKIYLNAASGQKTLLPQLHTDFKLTHDSIKTLQSYLCVCAVVVQAVVFRFCLYLPRLLCGGGGGGARSVVWCHWSPLAAWWSCMAP